MAAFNYIVFVILPIFVLGFQALLLPALFFLKSRNRLDSRAFAFAGGIIGVGFGYVFATVSGLQAFMALVILSVSLFGTLSGWCWWYLLVKRLSGEVDGS